MTRKGEPEILMALFELSSDITIGKFRFSGVHEVQVKRGIHSIVETAIIKIPSNGRIVEQGKEQASDIITSEQFKDGDHVTIKLGYNGNLQTEFKGFVKRSVLNMPLEIECEGYSWLLKRNTTTTSASIITVSELLHEAVTGLEDGYKITVICDVKMELGNVHLPDKSGAEIIQFVLDATDNCLSMFFIEPDVLWCGYLYTEWSDGKDPLKAGSVDLALGYNMPRGNSLKKRMPEKKDNVGIKYSKKKSKGEKLQKTSTAYKTFLRSHTKILNYIQDDKTLLALANEKAHQMNYTGYEGTITAFLQPFALAGCKAFVIDKRYGEQDGTYLIESTEVTFGVKGARRSIELGPKLGFAK